MLLDCGYMPNFYAYLRFMLTDEWCTSMDLQDTCGCGYDIIS